MPVADVHRSLGLDALKTRTFQIFKASALKGEGLDEAMEWLITFRIHGKCSRFSRLSNALQQRK